LNKNLLDGRTTTARLLRIIEQDLAADAGGSEYLTNRERVLLRRCAAQVLILESIEGFVFQQASLLTEGNELLPILRKGYVAHVNTLRLNLLALGLKPDRADKLPSLHDYIASKASSVNGTPGSAGGTEKHEHAATKAGPAPDPPEAA
jgi:hypothetical protein